ncbi:hypothetical protein [Embleya sp. NPDC059237]|uniref:hypothetical protein n=1 Tax=Embleya sp. NPDC059237 TaxID=3346784 RepID=UPI00369F6719
MKTCSRCKRTLLIDAFVIDRSRPDGRCRRCRTCHNERVRDYRRRVRAQLGPARRPTTDVEEAYVLRAVDGDPLPDMTPAERYEAVRRLTARGLAAGPIAELLHVAKRTVQRARTATGAVPAACQGCLGRACRWHTRAAA